MGATSKIEWTDASWNPVRARADVTMPRGAALGWHCEHVSEGCRFCYAEVLNRRLGTGLDYKPGHRRNVALFLDEKMLTAPLRWREPRRIFVGSMTDLFADFVTDEMLDRVFAVMALARRHTFQLLTKRPARMRAYVTAMATGGRHVTDWLDQHPNIEERRAAIALIAGTPMRAVPLPNVWLGASVEDQAAADARIPDLLATPAAKRFLSCEPLLGPVDLNHIDVGEDDWKIDCLLAGSSAERWDGSHWMDADSAPREAIDWVIAGGESGAHARPMHPAWARGLRDQCAVAGVPFFFKQWGEWGFADFDTSEATHWFGPHGLRERSGTATFGAGDVSARRFGKKLTGRTLDGVTHDGVPA